MNTRHEALTRTLDLLGELLGPGQRGDIDAALGATRVHIAYPSSRADARTQAALYVLVCLLARSGVAVEAQLAAGPRLVALPGLDSPDFSEAMLAVVPRMFPGAKLGLPAGSPAFTIVFGDDPGRFSGTVIRICAHGPRAWVARNSNTAGPWAPDDSLVALAAVGLGAGEVFKDILRPLSVRHLEELDPLEPTFTVPFRMQETVNLGPIVVISAGAITQMFLMTLAAEGGISADLTIFDGDLTELSNVNRCPFVMTDALNVPKVDAVKQLVGRQRLVSGRLEVTPIARHLDEETQHLVAPGSTVVVGADDVAVRHRAQALQPIWLVIGATSHFLTLITEHPANQACAGCAHHALGDDVRVIPTWSLISFWAGYLVALRTIAHGAGMPYSAARRVTTFWPLHPDAIFEHGLAFSSRCPVRRHSEADQVA